MSFGTQLKEARMKAGRKLRELSDASGLAISVLSEMEHGKRMPPSQEIITKIECYLKTSPGKLVRAASEQESVQARTREIFSREALSRRPILSMALLRLADMPDEDIDRFLKTPVGKEVANR